MPAPVSQRRAIVHVGLPRTGTTTLQRVLSGARPRLAAEGVLYPELTPRSASEPHLSHQYLGEALDGRRRKAEQAELLGALASQLVGTQADVVLLSYERLCLASPWLGVPRRLAALFARHGFAMEVLVTLKPQDELVNSTYTWRTQFLREGRLFGNFFEAEIRQSWLDLARLLQSWRAACDGRLSAIAVRDPRSSLPLVERIFGELGILPRLGVAADDLALVENRSPGPVAIEVARRLRRGGAHRGLAHAARDVTRFVEAAAQARGLNGVQFSGLDPAMRATAARWDAANDRFARQVWGEPWSARVAPAPVVPGNEIAGRPDDHVEDILRETCERYRLRLTSGPGDAIRHAAGSARHRLGRALRPARARIS